MKKVEPILISYIKVCKEIYYKLLTVAICDKLNPKIMLPTEKCANIIKSQKALQSLTNLRKISIL